MEIRLIWFPFFSALLSMTIPRQVNPLQIEYLFSFGNFSRPRAISIAPSGLVYVVDTGNNKLKVYSSSGDSIREIGGYGWGQLEFDRPYDVAAGTGLNVYVADNGNHRIQRFDKDLNYISTLYTRESEDPSQRLGYPVGVAVSRLGDLFIIDDENVRVVKVNTFSTIERTFGGIDAGKGRLKNPRQLGLTGKDLVCVFDEQRIVVFDNFGNYVRTIGQGVLPDPRGMTVDRDTIFVASDKEILLFTSEGKLLDVLKPPLGSMEGDGQRINDIAVYGGRIFILTDEVVRVYTWKEKKSP